MSTIEVYNVTALHKAILEGTTLSDEQKEDVIIWLADALNLFAGPKMSWLDRGKICEYIIEKFDSKYEKYWSCVVGQSLQMNKIKPEMAISLSNNYFLVLMKQKSMNLQKAKMAQ